MSVEGLSPIVPLVYTDISGINQYTNVLLIDNSVADYQIFVDSANSSTFPVVYSTGSTKSDVLAFLQSYFTTIPRIGMCFTSSSGGPKTFLDNEPFFTDDEPVPYSANLQFILDIISEFQVKNIDYLACDTLGYPNWKNYYDVLANNTGVTVGASSDKTGNIFYGGDWVLESTNEDVELMYFTQNIEYYTYLLDTLSWATSANGLNGCVAIELYNGYLYVTNYTNNTIIKINPNNASDWSTWFGSGILNTPHTIVYYSGYFFVCNANGNTITRIDATNPASYVASWVSGLNNPLGITQYNDYLYVTNYGSNIITKINPIDATSTTFATSTSGLGDLVAPRQIVYYNNYFYVTCTSKIVRINTAGVSTNWAIAATQGFGTIPDGMVIFSNSLYVTNIGTNPNTITVINLTNPTTQYVTSWVTGLNSPRGMCLYNKYLYITNYTGSTISLITSLANWATPSNALNGCEGITLYNGYFYVTNYTNNSITKINVDNASDYSVWTTAGLSSPFGIVYYSGYFYVCNYGGGTTGSTITRIDATNPATYSTWANNATQGLYGSYGLTILSGYLYVCNFDNSTIIKINTTDATAIQFASSTAGLGDLVGPRCITYYNNFFYVSNTGKIVKITTAGVSTNNWATTAQGLEAGATVFGLATYDNCLYVSNLTASKIVIINIDNPGTASYNTLQFINSWPLSLDLLNSPREMYVYNDNLYLCNYGSSSICKIPLEKGFFWFTYYSAAGLAIKDNYLYLIGNSNATIYRININDATDNIAWLTIGHASRGIATDGTYLYLPDGVSNITRVNISTKQIDTGWATSTNGVGNSRQVHVNGDYLYVGNYSVGGVGTITKLNLSNPNAGDSVAVWKTVSNGIEAITSDKNYIYLGADLNGRTTRISLTDPTNFVNIGNLRGCVPFDGNLYAQYGAGIIKVGLPRTNMGATSTYIYNNFNQYYSQCVVSYPYLFTSNIACSYISRFTLPSVTKSSINGNGYITGNGYIIQNF